MHQRKSKFSTNVIIAVEAWCFRHDPEMKCQRLKWHTINSYCPKNTQASTRWKLCFWSLLIIAMSISNFYLLANRASVGSENNLTACDKASLVRGRSTTTMHSAGATDSEWGCQPQPYPLPLQTLLAPLDFFLFYHLKGVMKRQRFHSIQDDQATATRILDIK